MGIIAGRERRRFNQMRRLGIEIPFHYVRIMHPKKWPKIITKELVKYPHAITDDSEYEEDEDVIEKYKGNKFLV